MNDTATIGTWQEKADFTVLSRQTMHLSSEQLARHWRRCSLSADFWSRYNALFVPTTVEARRLRRSDLEHVLAYLLNELFENCAKFSGGALSDVQYECLVGADCMRVTLTNHIRPERRESFATFIAELLSGDPDELYFARLEANAESDSEGSGLGYLTMIKDYGIRFGFRFAPAGPDSVAVSVQALVQLEER
ncbi:MAG: hypothetical protein HC822_05320 [Oscillochloris sp.]|nr:hypothetical protein [Oscillochloris sp.]